MVGVSDYIWEQDNTIFVIDNETVIRALTFDGTTITEISSFNSFSQVSAIWGYGTFLFTADQTFGIVALNFNGVSFSPIDNISPANGSVLPSGIWGDGTYIYMASQDYGLTAYTFDGTNLVEVGYSSASFDAISVWGDSSYIYVANQAGGLDVYSFDGSNFSLLDTFDTAGTAQRVWIDNGYVFVADGTAGIYVFTFDGTNLTQIGLVDTLNATLVWSDGDYIYVADSTDGVKAYLFNPPDTTAPDAPIITSFDSDTGVIGDQITTDTTLRLSGTAEANSTVDIYDGAVLLGTTTTDTGGDWLFNTASLSLGSHGFSAIATDADDNVSDASTMFSVTINSPIATDSVPDLFGPVPTIYKDFLALRSIDTNLSGLSGDDTISGSNIGNVIYGNQGDDNISANEGADTVFGGQDNDQINGNNNHDWLFGNKGQDIINGDGQNDFAYGNLDNDQINGGTGNDALFGGRGNDILNGGDGADTLSGNLGDDIFTGGTGKDAIIIAFSNNQGNDTIEDFSFSDGDYIISGASLDNLTYTDTSNGLVISYDGGSLLLRDIQSLASNINVVSGI